MDDMNGKQIGWRLLDIAVALVVTIAMGITGWTAATIVDLRERVAKIEASRFTASDGVAMWKELSSLPRQVPAKWFEERVNALVLQVNTLADRINQLDRRIVQLQMTKKHAAAGAKQ